MSITFKTEDKGKVLATLYNASQPLGLGILHFDPTPMTESVALEILKEQTYFDYLLGRVMKIDLSSNTFDPRLYDRDNGVGRASIELFKAGIEIEVRD